MNFLKEKNKNINMKNTNNTSPEHPYDTLDTQTTLPDEPKVNVVIAHYNEDLTWLNHMPNNFIYHIYYKGNPPNEYLFNKFFQKDIDLIPLPNIGRETHTYLTHIINNYDYLDGLTIFLQGSPHEHLTNFLDILATLDYKANYQEFGIEFNEIVWNNNQYHINPKGTLDEQLNKYFQLIFNQNYPDKSIVFTPGCQFALNTQTIKAKPKAYYEQLLNYSVNDQYFPFIFERILKWIFK